MATAQRLVIAAPPGAQSEQPPAAWAQGCKLALGLDERDARRLWAKLPVTITLPALNDALLAEAVRRLEKAGAKASVTPHAFQAPRCKSHRRAAADEVCPRCKERRACGLCLSAGALALCPRCSGRSRFFTTFRNARIAILFSILVVVAFVTWNDNRRVTSWKQPLTVTVIPVDASGDANVALWIATLDAKRFQPVAEFLAAEAAKHGLALGPPVAEIRFAKPILELPPAEPEDPGNRLKIAAWSLNLRWWSWRASRRHAFPSSTVKMYVLYEKDRGQIPEESLGIKQGRIGIVRTIAGEHEASWTNVLVTHELLHTLGATDKYLPGGQPMFPDGYAESKLLPIVPQVFAEIMAGQIPLEEEDFVQARSLSKCIVGKKTAVEIGWKKRSSL